MSEHVSIDRPPGGPRDEAPIGDLIRLAGRRAEPSALRTARVRAAVEAEWRRSVPRRSRWSLWSLGTAAVVALALVLWARTSSLQPTTPPALATLARVTGAVHLSSAGSAPRPAAAGERLTPGVTLDTSAGGRAALTFDSGESVRLDRGSRMLIEATNRLTLERGRVYVDSGEGTPSGGGLQIATRSGVVHEIGTQFEVDAAWAFVEVRVREGAVRIEQTHTSIDVGDVEAVRITPDGVVERKSIARFGPEWSWTAAIAPPFTIEGARLESFLQWVSREQGWDWQFRDATAARHGKGVVLHGTIEGLTPAEALGAVLPACDMTSQLRGARLFVGVASRSEQK